MIKKLFNKLVGNNRTAISFKQGMDLTELPIITLYQDNNRFNFLLDTGSNDSIIDSNTINKIANTPIKSKNTLSGLGGEKQIVNKCTIELSYKDKSYTYDYLIVDMKRPFDDIKKSTGVNLHGIIGSKFFNRFKYVLDFAELIAYSKE